jgi:hypothetical protein
MRTLEQMNTLLDIVDENLSSVADNEEELEALNQKLDEWRLMITKFYTGAQSLTGGELVKVQSIMDYLEQLYAALLVDEAIKKGLDEGEQRIKKRGAVV